MARRVALVTGGTGGIGTAIVDYLAANGYKVATSYRNPARIPDWERGRAKRGYDIFKVKCDITDFESCASMVSAVENELGPIDVLVNNAGITRDTTFRKMSAEQWQMVIDTNLCSIFNVTRQVVNGMVERNFGRVVSIASVNGQKGQFGQTNYSASKAGIHGFTKALAQEVAKKNVTVNTVSPGYIETEMVLSVPQAAREQIIAQIPVGRLGRPAEVARMVAFLVSEDSGFITGADFSINGGQHMY